VWCCLTLLNLKELVVNKHPPESVLLRVARPSIIELFISNMVGYVAAASAAAYIYRTVFFLKITMTELTQRS
jgi:hypothetical protein